MLGLVLAHSDAQDAHALTVCFLCVSHTSALRSSERLVYTFSRNTFSLIDERKQKSRAELQKSVSWGPSLSALQLAVTSGSCDIGPTELGGSWGNIKNFPVALLLFYTQKPYAQPTSRLTQRLPELSRFQRQRQAQSAQLEMLCGLFTFSNKTIL